MARLKNIYLYVWYSYFPNGLAKTERTRWMYHRKLDLNPESRIQPPPEPDQSKRRLGLQFDWIGFYLTRKYVVICV